MLGEQIQGAGRKIYLNIKEGAIVRRTDAGEEKYAFVEGAVEKIYQKERNFRGEAVMYWYIDLRDGSGELYSLGFPYGSNTFKSIILSLATATDLQQVKIKPYTANGYDKVVCYANGVKLDWISKQLPPVEEVVFGGRRVKDDSKRMAYISSLVEEIGKQVVKKQSNIYGYKESNLFGSH